MFCCLLLCLSLLARWFGSVSGSPAVDEVYAAVVGVLSPGGQNLTGETLRTLFNTLENRVQCGEVSCEKVGFIRQPGEPGEPGGNQCAPVERDRGPNIITLLHLLIYRSDKLRFSCFLKIIFIVYFLCVHPECFCLLPINQNRLAASEFCLICQISLWLSLNICFSMWDFPSKVIM